MKKKLNKLAEILTEMGLYGESEHIQKISQTLPEMGGEPVASPYKTEGYQVKVDSQSPHSVRYMGPKSKRKRSNCNPSWSVEKCNAWLEEAPYRDPRTGLTDEQKALSGKAPSPDPLKEPAQLVLKRTQRPWLIGCRRYPKDEKAWLDVHKSFDQSFLLLELSFSDAWQSNASILSKNFTVNHGPTLTCLMEQLQSLALPGETQGMLPWVSQDIRPAYTLTDILNNQNEDNIYGKPGAEYMKTLGNVTYIWNQRTRQFEKMDDRMVYERCPNGNCHASPASRVNWNDLTRSGPVFNMQSRKINPQLMYLDKPDGVYDLRTAEWPEQVFPEEQIANYRLKIQELSFEIQELFRRFDKLEKRKGTQLSAGADARMVLHDKIVAQARKIRRMHKALIPPAKKIRPWEYQVRPISFEQVKRR